MHNGKTILPVRIQYLGTPSAERGIFAPGMKLVIAGTKGAHGDAGWSTIECDDIEHAHQIARDYPQAFMPVLAPRRVLGWTRAREVSRPSARTPPRRKVRGLSR